MAKKDIHEDDRLRLITEIEAEAKMTASYTGRGAISKRVLEAVKKVPRHEFVPPEDEYLAYENAPLPIGYGQTISQPFIVAIMTELLDLRPNARVLDVGTGSGYQAAVLAEIAEEVYSVEVVEELADVARERLKRLGYDNVHVKAGDGHKGWPDKAPFDGILVAAAASDIPEALSDQLAEGGRMIIPMGGGIFSQDLTLVTKSKSGRIKTETVLPVRFVPFVEKEES